EDGTVEERVNPAYQAWRKSDCLLRGWITGTLAEEVMGTIIGLQTSKEVWNTLMTHFSHKCQEREHLLMQKLQTYKKRSLAISDYICGFKKICDELAAIGKPIEDHSKVFWLLSGLGQEYESFTTTMMKPPTPSYIDVQKIHKSQV
ncbi:hypothetical protein EJ110_NYTH57686, partial [Nymphaea thermarum]